MNDNKRLKISFHGKMGSGKDTAVDYLIEKYGGEKITFAEPLYNILNYAQKVCGFEIEKDRKFLQFIGTEWAREKNENIWVDIAIEKIRENTCNMFNNDCRFYNELDSLKKEGFLCIKIKRNLISKDRVGNGNINHESEYGIDDHYFDFVIENEDTKEELYSKLENIIQIVYYTK